MAPNDTTMLIAHLPSPLVEELEQFALSRGCTRSAVVTAALAAWMSQQEQTAHQERGKEEVVEKV